MSNQRKVSLNSIVAKSNELVPKLARYDLQELRLIAYCIAHYDSRKPENRRFTARVEDLAEIFPSMDKKSAYDVIRRAVGEINSKPVEFVDAGKKHYSVWFSGFIYRENEGIFEFSISPLIEPYLLELKERFNIYRLGDVHNFRSASTWKLYEHLNSHKHTGLWHVSIEELHTILGAAESYARFNLFRYRVIDPAVIEINEKSNLTVEYVKERGGRKVAALLFFIQTQEKIYVNKEEHDKNMLLRLLLQAGIKHETAEKLLAKILATGKKNHFLQKIPEIMNRWTEAKGPAARYLTGALKSEIRTVNSDSRPYAEAYRCWAEKKIAQTKCRVRQRGKAGNRHKCKMCFQYMPPDTFGV
jgi:plasmid replication initiation protein